MKINVLMSVINLGSFMVIISEIFTCRVLIFALFSPRRCCKSVWKLVRNVNKSCEATDWWTHRHTQKHTAENVRDDLIFWSLDRRDPVCVTAAGTWCVWDHTRSVSVCLRRNSERAQLWKLFKILFYETTNSISLISLSSSNMESSFSSSGSAVSSGLFDLQGTKWRLKERKNLIAPFVLKSTNSYHNLLIIIRSSVM